jgi:hypothetical protein
LLATNSSHTHIIARCALSARSKRRDGPERTNKHQAAITPARKIVTQGDAPARLARAERCLVTRQRRRISFFATARLVRAERCLVTRQGSAFPSSPPPGLSGRSDVWQPERGDNPFSPPPGLSGRSDVWQPESVCRKILRHRPACPGGAMFDWSDTASSSDVQTALRPGKPGGGEEGEALDGLVTKQRSARASRAGARKGETASLSGCQTALRNPLAPPLASRG